MQKIPKILKGIGLSLLVLMGVLLLGYGFAYWKAARRLNRVYPTQTIHLPIPTDSASIARGAHQYVIKGCRDCHGKDLSGRILLSDPLLGTITVPNLTKGRGGRPRDYNARDWLRVLKHGVNREGKPLLIMPAEKSAQIPDQDLADLIAYCQSRPPVDHALPQRQVIGPLGRVLVAAGEVKTAAEVIDHTPKPIAGRKADVTAAYGAYLATACTGCHREDFRGGKPVTPGSPPVPNITAAGQVGQWTEAQFMRTLRTGIRPDGRPLKNGMPWQMTREFTDVELKALRTYLVGLPGKPS